MNAYMTQVSIIVTSPPAVLIEQGFPPALARWQKENPCIQLLRETNVPVPGEPVFRKSVEVKRETDKHWRTVGSQWYFYSPKTPHYSALYRRLKTAAPSPAHMWEISQVPECSRQAKVPRPGCVREKCRTATILGWKGGPFGAMFKLNWHIFSFP